MDNWQASQEAFLDLLLEGNTHQGVRMARSAIDAGKSPVDFFEYVVAPALAEVGRRFETLEVFLPEMVVAAEVVDRVKRDVLDAAVKAAGAAAAGPAEKVVLATVKGDLHDIGKNMVALLLSVNGFDVVDLGTDVSPGDIITAAEKEGAAIIGLSALLTPCLPYMKDVSDQLRARGIRDRYTVIVGGAATNRMPAAQVGADAVGNSAAEAVVICRRAIADRTQARGGEDR